MRAMVVDDSRATRAILRRILEELGYEVVDAADGREGLDVLAANPDVELALVDWNMPVMNGLEMVKAIRAAEDEPTLKIVMVTTEGDTDHIVAAIEAGADEYAMKPFTAGVIREKLELLGVTI
ncbi:MAG: response regulator [Nitriliruptoraceae bacterium]|nr:response regulator [Nitriliruptoraceae bacterium]